MIEIHDFYGPTDWGWVTGRVPMKRVEDTCGFMATDTVSGETKGAIILDNFLNSSCQATIILESPMALKYGLLDIALEHVFCDMGLTHVYCLIADTNKPSLRLSAKVGFIEKFRIPNGYSNGVDFIVTELDRENCAIYKKLRGEEHGLARRCA